ncbi:MAG: hypothetical protein ACI9XK_004944, partial [Granulosicoccus sp.]
MLIIPSGIPYEKLVPNEFAKLSLDNEGIDCEAHISPPPNGTSINPYSTKNQNSILLYTRKRINSLDGLVHRRVHRVASPHNA